MCARGKDGEKGDDGCIMRELDEMVLLGKIYGTRRLTGIELPTSETSTVKWGRTAHEPHGNVACLCSFEDLSDAWTALQVLRGIRVLRGGKSQERIHVCELSYDESARRVSE